MWEKHIHTSPIWNGECNLALVWAVLLILGPIELAKHRLSDVAIRGQR